MKNTAAKVARTADGATRIPATAVSEVPEGCFLVDLEIHHFPHFGD